MTSYMVQTNHCRSIPDKDEYSVPVCVAVDDWLSDGGRWLPAERVTPHYLAVNFYTGALAFVLTFALVMIGPPIWRSYRAWLSR